MKQVVAKRLELMLPIVREDPVLVGEETNVAAQVELTGEAVKLKSLVGRSNSDVMPGSDYPLSLRKKPSKFPSSRLQLYEACSRRLSPKRLSANTSTAS